MTENIWENVCRCRPGSGRLCEVCLAKKARGAGKEEPNMSDIDEPDTAITDINGRASFEVVAYRYTPPEEPGMLEIRDDGYPLEPEPPCIWLRIEDRNCRVPQYFELDLDTALALAGQLYDAADELSDEMS
jgi:hypothetical protein